MKIKDLPPRPSPSEIKTNRQLFKLLEWFSDPIFYGLENLPQEGPALLVGNHTLLGLWDASIMWHKLYHEKEIFLYSLGDHNHFKVPVWKDLVTKFGVVHGSRENCSRLMQLRQFVLVFPGGTREVFKNKGEAYTLKWENRLGFAKMAIQNNCPIIPFSAVGAEECYELIWDSKEILDSSLGKILKTMGIRKDFIIPLVKGAGLTPLPKPQRFYYKFGKPISVEQYQGNWENKENCEDLKNKTQAAVEYGLEALLRLRAKDPQRKLYNRILQKFNPLNILK